MCVGSAVYCSEVMLHNVPVCVRYRAAFQVGNVNSFTLKSR